MNSPFNLVDSEWLPVVTATGPQLVSLTDSLVDANRIRGFDGLNAPQAVALTRFLVAILVDVFRWSTPHQWAGAWTQGCFDPEPIRAYLGEHHDNFDVIGGTGRFYQVPELQPLGSGGIKPAALLLPEVASGNNVPLFSVVIDRNVPPLSPAEAVLRLITLQSYDTAAIKTGVVGDPNAKAGKTTGNPTGPVGGMGIVLAQGETLFETLMLNYPLGPVDGDDLPAWRKSSGPTWEQRASSGLLDLLTWQSRRVRMFSDEQGLVDRVIVAAGDRLDFVPPSEPHTIWRQVKNGPVAQRPGRHPVGRTPWRGLTSLLTLQPSNDAVSTSRCLTQIGDLQAEGLISQDYPLDVLCVGVVYGNMSAVVEEIVVDSMPLPVLALAAELGQELRDRLLALASSGDAVVAALNHLDGDLRRSRGGDAIPWDGAQRAGEVFASGMEEPTRRLLRAVQDSGATAEPLAEWEFAARDVARAIADRLLTSQPPEAFMGRGGKGLGKAAIFFAKALKDALPRAHSSRGRTQHHVQGG